ncbi:hypothetical protein SY88_02640 [Clostridiales bacterium PH28_bin88]|nr:hypothetical protein SY88_02640 [Clostridiales bacterium PH28_bin88]
METAVPPAEALVVKDGRIAAIGSVGEIKDLAKAAGEVIDAGGRTVLPGFIDCHTHFMQTGLAEVGVDLKGKTSREQVLESVAEAARGGRELILGFGFDDSLFPDRQPPTRWDLDRVAPGHLVWLNRIDSHSCVVNSRTLSLTSLPPGIPGVDVDERGTATGVLRAEANFLARAFVSNAIDSRTREQAMTTAAGKAAEAGITSLCALEGGGGLFSDRDVEYLLANKGRLEVRVDVFWQTREVGRVARAGLPRIGGCLLVDGSIGSRTAAMSRPYLDDPSTTGVLYFSQEELDSFVLEAHRAGLQVAMHVIGDRGIELLVTAFEKALTAYPRANHRHRLEHFELPTEDQIRRVKRLGLILSMQPAFEYFWGGPDRLYARRLGEERRRRTNPLRELLKKGILVAGGSDSDVTPMDPLLGIHAAVNHPSPDQRISVEEALRMFTINGAVANFAEQDRGSLAPGKLADLVVLGANPLETPVNEFKDIPVEMTVIGGKVVFTSK